MKVLKRDDVIVLKMTQADKENISNMAPEATKIAFFPDHVDEKVIYSLFKELDKDGS